MTTGTLVAQPLKWRKYELLEAFGLISREELSRDIRRYTAGEQERVKADLRRRLVSDRNTGKRNLYVVKLVPIFQRGQLPNLRLSRPDEVALFDAFLARYKAIRFQEIWFCQTAVDSATFSVAGRLSFFRDGFPRSIILEQLWRSSPRLIEQVHKGESSVPYVRAERCHWGWHYYITDFHNGGSDIDEARLISEFQLSARLIERARGRVERFCDFLEKLGYRSYSLEYKIVDYTLSIIDWDTHDDAKALRQTPLHFLQRE